MAEQLSEEELEAIVSTQIELAKAHDRSERDKPRAKALDYYLGNMDKYVPPETNRSKVVSRDVADTIGWMLPDIMRVFTASDRMAEAEPVGPEDIQFAQQATDGLNYVFWKDNKGYEIVYAATWDALLVGNGIVKTYYDETPVYATSFHSGLTEDQVALLLQDEAIEVLARTDETQIVGIDELGQPVELVLTEIKIRRKKYDGRFVIEVIPPEDFLIDRDAITTDEAAFTDHWQQLPRSALVAMGYDKEEIWAIPEAGRVETPEEVARNLERDTEANDKSMELVDYHECYLRLDIDGDGEAELVRACYGGGQNGTLLDWEVWEDEHPFDDIPCEPIPHRWDARSIADETMDIQDIKTVLTRQMLNNTYWVNHPQQAVIGKVKNPEALTQPDFGVPVFLDPGSQVVPLERPYIGDKALLALTHFDEVRQSRTGVGRQSMALDPEVLQNQTATASNNNRDASRSQVELIARNMAEWGWRKVFRKLMRLMIKHQDYTRTLIISGKPVQIDPRHWNADMDVTINVGLGTGSRDRDLAMLGVVQQDQMMLIAGLKEAGFDDKALDMLPFLHSTLMKKAESAGIRNPEAFFPDVTADDIASGKQALAERAKQPPLEVQLETARASTQMALKDKDVEVSLNTAKIDADSDVIKNQAELEADLQTRAADRQNALVLEQRKADNAFRLEQEQIASNERIKAATLDFERYKLDVNTQLEREKMASSAQIAAMKPAPTKPMGKSNGQ